MMQRLNGMDWLAMIFIIIGGLNWGLIGVFGFDLIAFLLGPMTIFSRLIYIIVGASSLYMLYLAYKLRRK